MWEVRYHIPNVKILRILGVSKRIFGKPGGARLPQAPPVATPMLLHSLGGAGCWRAFQNRGVPKISKAFSKMKGAPETRR